MHQPGHTPELQHGARSAGDQPVTQHTPAAERPPRSASARGAARALRSLPAARNRVLQPRGPGDARPRQPRAEAPARRAPRSPAQPRAGTPAAVRGAAGRAASSRSPAGPYRGPPAQPGPSRTRWGPRRPRLPTTCLGLPFAASRAPRTGPDRTGEPPAPGARRGEPGPAAGGAQALPVSLPCPCCAAPFSGREGPEPV